MEYNEKVVNQIRSYCEKKPGAYEARPFGEYPICYKVMGKIFAQVNPGRDFYKITLKCEPQKAELYRQLYPEVVVRGYHCPPVQQPYWNTIDLNLFEDMEMLYQMIDEAYEALIQKMKKKDKAHMRQLFELEYVDTDGDDADFACLCKKLDDELDRLVGGRVQRSEYVQYNQRDSIHDVIVVYQNNLPVACGSFKMYDDEHVELKRVYVDKSCNGIGLGAEIVRRLEAKAKIQGYKWCILETGEPLQAACHMYKKLGYKVIANYGQYADMPASICMGRKI